MGAGFFGAGLFAAALDGAAMAVVGRAINAQQTVNMQEVFIGGNSESGGMVCWATEIEIVTTEKIVSERVVGVGIME
ncbi:MAG TPA: hypothetical protein VIK18_19895 [Pirellulales bacterium]